MNLVSVPLPRASQQLTGAVPAGRQGRRPCFPGQVTSGSFRLPPLGPPLAGHTPGGSATPPQGCTPRPNSGLQPPTVWPVFEAYLERHVYHVLRCLHIIGLAPGGLLQTFLKTKGLLNRLA